MYACGATESLGCWDGNLSESLGVKVAIINVVDRPPTVLLHLRDGGQLLVLGEPEDERTRASIDDVLILNSRSDRRVHNVREAVANVLAVHGNEDGVVAPDVNLCWPYRHLVVVVLPIELRCATVRDVNLPFDVGKDGLKLSHLKHVGGGGGCWELRPGTRMPW